MHLAPRLHVYRARFTSRRCVAAAWLRCAISLHTSASRPVHLHHLVKHLSERVDALLVQACVLAEGSGGLRDGDLAPVSPSRQPCPHLWHLLQNERSLLGLLAVSAACAQRDLIKHALQVLQRQRKEAASKSEHANKRQTATNGR
eukprot:342273-Chlamydomonas_euryale.AAC.4